MRLVFAGTPEVAIPSLTALAAAGHDLRAVVTRPPAAQGRSSRLVPSPVHEWGLAHRVEVLTPTHPRDPEFSRRLTELAPDCVPVVAYGALVPERVIGIPTYGWVNLHFSLLPAYRGAAPVQRAIMAGDRETGATTFALVKELDAGPVYRMVTEPIGPRDTSGDLLGRLAIRGGDLLVETLAAITAGERPRPQSADGISLAPKVEVADVRIDWHDGAAAIDRLIRAADPEPGTWTTLGGDRFKILQAERSSETMPAGEILVRRKEVLAGTGTSALRLLRVQPPGKRPMPALDWARGARLAGGEAFE